MFEFQEHPRVFSVPVGRNYLNDLVSGLIHRFDDHPPEALAKTEIYVNTRRAERKLHALLTQSGARLLPRVHLLTQIDSHPCLPIRLPAPESALKRRLMLAQLIKALLQKEPGLAPKTAIFSLANSLAAVVDEFQSEGVSFSSLEQINVDDLSGHWDNSLKFLRILSDHWSATSGADPLDRQRTAAFSFAREWREKPPDYPVIVAGSTGSRGASAIFMKAVACLPQGAVVLPGVDLAMTDQSWEDLSNPKVSMDHPQSGINKFCQSLSLHAGKLPIWYSEDIPHQRRNSFISLALHPAPFTDRWLEDGPKQIATIAQATKGLTLLQTKDKKTEARSIALRLRLAAEEGKSAALISPDRDLTRRVTAALQRWQIAPDDSAGKPLHLSPPGVLLRLLVSCYGRKLTPLNLVSLLKHPLTARGDAENGNNRRFARDLERQHLRGGAPQVEFGSIIAWAQDSDDEAKKDWAKWLTEILGSMEAFLGKSLCDWVRHHRQAAERLAAGPGQSDQGALWVKESGQAALRVFDLLASESDAAGQLNEDEYRALFLHTLSIETVRESVTLHPDISILGTLEARVQDADVVILGGLNEGIWPKAAAPDPWLNRSMRKQIGLPLPERQTGLSAHDFQQAVGASEVWITRSVRDNETPTVASRWLLRMSNLLQGLGKPGQNALVEMVERGRVWENYANALDQPQKQVPKAPRPAPSPPITSRPGRLSVTQVKTLVRDPYAIYAREILRLKPMDMLGKEPDALVRGIALHKVVEEFISKTMKFLPDNSAELFIETAADILQREAPWPATRRFWLARLARAAEWFVSSERERRERGQVVALEAPGNRKIDKPEFLLTAKADRLDRDTNGNLIIYDYKTGSLPSAGEIKFFDKQLQLEAAIAETGGFKGLSPAQVVGLEYVGISDQKSSGTGKIQNVVLEPGLTERTWIELQSLIRAYDQPDKGYSARARMQTSNVESPYDHLSRRGEWEEGDPSETVFLSCQ